MKEVCRLLDDHGWVAIRGGPNTGKSQLAIQLATAHGNCRGWVRFHHSQATIESARLLDAALITLAGWEHTSRKAGWYTEASAIVGKGALLILDDLPRIPGEYPFAEQLSRFCQACRAAEVQVVSTSQFELPAPLHHSLGNAGPYDCPAPPFTEDEAREFFRAYGAPDPCFSASQLRFLNGRAAGHPLLLAATAEFLAERYWRYREDEIDALLRGDHTTRVMLDVVDRLTRTLGDPPRELLYRLTLPLGSFDQADVATLAGVEPVVERPRERLNYLIGAWVQRETDNRFTVSPLAIPLGRTELTQSVRCRCYCELAELITRKRVLDYFEAERAILYNLEAREFGRAVTLYVLTLVAALKVKEDRAISWVIDKWRETPLPTELSVGNRLFARAYQLAAFTRFKLDTRFIVRDIDVLLGQATEADGWGIVALAVQNLGLFRTQDPARALGYARRAIELSRVCGPDGEEIVFDRIYFPDMLWMLVTDLRTPALQHQWFDAVEALPSHEHQRFWNTELARQGVWLVPNRLYSTEWEKPKAEQDWDGTLRALDGLRRRAERLNQSLLEAVYTGIMLDIHGDLKRFDELPAIAEPTLARWPNDPDVQFEVRGTWGRQHAFRKRADLALPLLDTALAQPHRPNDHERLRCLLAANCCAGDGTLSYGERARSSRQAPPIEAARALGEYALSCFQLRGDRAGAVAVFPAWSEAMRKYFSIADRDKI